MPEYSYYLFHKPYGYACRFTDDTHHPGIGQLLSLEKDVYPVGRLDTDSEGLLILTNDSTVNGKILLPSSKWEKEYHAQVEGIPSPEQLERMKSRLLIKVDKKEHKCLPAYAALMNNYEWKERTPPIRFRKTVPDSWVKVILTEGKNRQVRKMLAAIGFPCLRLVRHRIGPFLLGAIPEGCALRIDPKEFQSKLRNYSNTH